MKKQYFNSLELKKACELHQTNPMEAKNRYEEYLEKYPTDYSAHTYYIGVLIILGEFDEAEKALNDVINVSKYDKFFMKQKNKMIQFKEKVFVCKIRLLLYREKYNELYMLLENNYNLVKEMSLQSIAFYVKRKLNIPNFKPREDYSYRLQQMIKYEEKDFFENIEKYLENYMSDLNTPNKKVFISDFPIEKVIEETKKYVPSNKCLFSGNYENVYVFKYTNCGKDNNRTANYFKVVCFHNTQDYITIFPCADCENLPYVDLDYLINTNEMPKVKTLSQIEKFNKRYNHK